MTPQVHVVALGTGGGPTWDRAGERHGIATALMVGDRTYLVDAGSGVGRQLARAGRGVDSLRAIFITHLHSDHIVDLGALMLFGIIRMPQVPTHHIPIVGPGPRGMMPLPSPRMSQVLAAESPADPTPGIAGTFEGLMRAYATDINDRHLDAMRSRPRDWFVPQEILIPDQLGFHPNDNPTPEMEPFPVYEDDAVRVSATLVKHAPMTPAFGYRFETEEGVFAISGDTGPTSNVSRLAAGADVLFHEALDFDAVERQLGPNPAPAALAVRDHHYSAHTSPADAMRIAEEAGARQLALHHLVPRAGAGEVWRRGAEAYSGTLHVPDDLDIISLR